MRHVGKILATLVIGVALCATTAAAQTYDLVILNGRVTDPETMFDAIANVGIKGGRIQAITKEKITGKETIDATGLLVAPGFIDTHFHSVDVSATKMSVRDGVTTGMDLEQGAARVGPWYAEKEKGGWQVNFGTTSSLLFTRLFVRDPEVKFDGLRPVQRRTPRRAARRDWCRSGLGRVPGLVADVRPRLPHEDRWLLQG